MNPQCPYGRQRFLHNYAPSSGLSRREWLARSAGVLGFWAAGGWQSLLAAEKAAPPPNLPHRGSSSPALPVSIQRCESYEPALVKEKLDAALDGIGGIGRLVRDKTV